MRLLHNPSINDVIVDYDKYGSDPETHTLKAGNVEEFDDHIADLIEDKLANRMLWDNYPKDRNRDKYLREIRKLIRV